MVCVMNALGCSIYQSEGRKKFESETPSASLISQARIASCGPQIIIPIANIEAESNELTLVSSSFSENFQMLYVDRSITQREPCVMGFEPEFWQENKVKIIEETLVAYSSNTGGQQ